MHLTQGLVEMCVSRVDLWFDRAVTITQHNNEKVTLQRNLLSFLTATPRKSINFQPVPKRTDSGRFREWGKQYTGYLPINEKIIEHFLSVSPTYLKLNQTCISLADNVLPSGEKGCGDDFSLSVGVSLIFYVIWTILCQYFSPFTPALAAWCSFSKHGRARRKVWVSALSRISYS